MNSDIQEILTNSTVQRNLCAAARDIGKAIAQSTTLRPQGIEYVVSMSKVLLDCGIPSTIVAGKALWVVNQTNQGFALWGYPNTNEGDWYPWLVLTLPNVPPIVVDCATALWPDTYQQETGHTWPRQFRPPEYLWTSVQYQNSVYEAEALAISKMKGEFACKLDYINKLYQVVVATMVFSKALPSIVVSAIQQQEENRVEPDEQDMSYLFN